MNTKPYKTVSRKEFGNGGAIEIIEFKSKQAMDEYFAERGRAERKAARELRRLEKIGASRVLGAKAMAAHA